MKQKKNLKGLIFVCLLSVSFLCAIFFGFNNSASINYVNLSINTQCLNASEKLNFQQSEILQNELFSQYASGNYTTLTHKNYVKGQEDVNIVFNFINYKGDNVNKLTSDEIENIFESCYSGITTYFNRMSRGRMAINVDYVVSISSRPHSFYYNLNANSLKQIGYYSQYYFEKDLLENSISERKDENGNVKTFKFSEYTIGINVFAGQQSAWNTFLWPHAWTGGGVSGPILLVEGVTGYSNTLCHELMHTFGAGDLYAYTGDSINFTAQDLDMMHTSETNTSTNAYYREKAGWLENSEYDDGRVTDIETFATDSRGSKTVNLYPNCTTNYDKTIAYKFGENKEKNEYFMIEYHIKNYGEKKFDPLLPKTGVVIYRVNTTAFGNSSGNDTDPYSYNEVIFMGDFKVDVSVYDYANTCLLTKGDTYGNRGTKTNKSLVYSGGKGKVNLFTGENSEISVKVDALTSEYATITITFKEDLEVIDLSDVNWNYEKPLTYNGQLQTIELTGDISTELKLDYIGTQTAMGAGTYTLTVVFDYDAELYVLRNQNFSLTLKWEILPAQITYTINNKTSTYGENLKPLTCAISEGKLYGTDSLNITLSKAEGLNVGSYEISGIVEENSNYDVTIIKGIYNITQRVVNIKVLNQEYYKKDFESIDYSKYEVLLGDTILAKDRNVVNLVVEDFVSAEVGTYVITALNFNDNYNLNVKVEGLLTILKDIEIIPDDAEVPENPTDPETPDKNHSNNLENSNQAEGANNSGDEKINRNILIVIISLCAGIPAISAVVYIIKIRRRQKQQNLWDENLLK